MEEDMYPGEKVASPLQEVRSAEIMLMLLAAAAILAILVIYGDAFGIYDKIASTYGDIWEIIFPR